MTTRLDVLAEEFEEHRAHLRAVAYRMLGSLTEADDALQETWLRLSRADRAGVENMKGWLTTVVGRVCLNLLRSRASRREEPLDDHVPDPIVTGINADPEHEALLVDSVGMALLTVLDALDPAERLAFVLHDVFAVPFDEIGEILGRSPAATRQLASRARRRVRGGASSPDFNHARQREIVEAFLGAARGGDFQALVSILDPEVVLRADFGGVPRRLRVVRGVEGVIAQARSYASFSTRGQLALVNGAAGVVVWRADEKPFAVIGFSTRNGKIVEMDVLADQVRLRRLDLSNLR